MTAPIITLTTDFGAGGYVAQMKGVLLAACPSARLVDVDHAIPPQAIPAAELVLRGVAFTFPAGTVHLVVIDPGVGTDRRPIAVAARGRFFVGPDNGVLGIAVAEPGARVVALDNPALHRHPVSSTFHGRDLFAPVAAAIANGVAWESLGAAVDDPIPSTLPAPIYADGEARGEVLGADHFGNLQTNLAGAALRGALGVWEVWVGGVRVPQFDTYGEAAAGALIALVGSDGFLELAVREGSAAERLGAEGGIAVECRRAGV